MAAEHLVFRPETFDLVTMGETLAYLADPTTALAEAHRVLRPGGPAGGFVPAAQPEHRAPRTSSSRAWRRWRAGTT